MFQIMKSVDDLCKRDQDAKLCEAVNFLIGAVDQFKETLALRLDN